MAYEESTYYQGLGSLTINSTAIPALIEVTLPDRTINYTDVQHSGLPDKVTRHLKGFRTLGELSFVCVYDATVLSNLETWAASDSTYAVEYVDEAGDSTSYDYTAYVNYPTVEVALDGQELRISCSLKLTGGAV